MEGGAGLRMPTLPPAVVIRLGSPLWSVLGSEVRLPLGRIPRGLGRGWLRPGCPGWAGARSHGKSSVTSPWQPPDEARLLLVVLIPDLQRTTQSPTMRIFSFLQPWSMEGSFLLFS